MPRPKMGNELTQFLLPPQHIEWLKKLAARQNTTMSDIVRKLINNYVVKQSKIASNFSPLDKIV